MFKYFEEFWGSSGFSKYKETALAAWEARQEEIDDLKKRLCPFEKAEFIAERTSFIIKHLYPDRNSEGSAKFKHPEMTWWHKGCYHIDQDLLSYPEKHPGLLGIEWSMLVSDHTVSHTTWVPQAWLNFDKQISNEDLLVVMKQWCSDLAETMAVEKFEKESQAKIEKIARLEAELAKAKSELK